MKQVILLVLALSTLCYAQSEKSQQADIEAVKTQVKELEAVIKTQKEQIRELQCVIKDQEAEIAALKSELKQIREVSRFNPRIHPEVDKNEDDRRTKGEKFANEIKAITKPIFGIYLGEKISNVQKRFRTKLLKKNSSFPEMEWRLVYHRSDIIRRYEVFSFDGRVSGISVYFKDSSELNYDALSHELSKKYQEVQKNLTDLFSSGDLERKFWTVIDNVHIGIILSFEEKPKGDNTLGLDYFHNPLVKKWKLETFRRKIKKMNQDW